MVRVSADAYLDLKVSQGADYVLDAMWLDSSGNNHDVSGATATLTIRERKGRGPTLLTKAFSGSGAFPSNGRFLLALTAAEATQLCNAVDGDRVVYDVYGSQGGTNSHMLEGNIQLDRSV